LMTPCARSNVRTAASNPSRMRVAPERTRSPMLLARVAASVNPAVDRVTSSMAIPDAASASRCAVTPLATCCTASLISPVDAAVADDAAVKDDAESSVTWLPKNEAPPHFIPSQASMHLERMVAVVASCKKAIWGAYNKLYSEDPISPRPNDPLGRTRVLKEEFEFNWTNWECDMRSRIDMENNTKERLRWTVCLPPWPERDSDLGRWHKCVKEAQSEKDFIDIIASSQPEKPDVVRCVRGFVAWKFSGSAPEANLPNEREQV